MGASYPNNLPFHSTKSRAVLTLFLSVGLGGLAAGLFLQHLAKPGILSTEEYTQLLVQKCKHELRRSECYEREIPKLMDFISMEEAFQVTRLVLEKDPSYGYCHVLGHKLSGREVRKNPAHWKEVLARCPTDLCNYGCLHGPLLERFGTQFLGAEEINHLLPQLGEMCGPKPNWKPTPWERAMCYHGMGHLAMYLTRADLEKSVAICRFLGNKEGVGDMYPVCLEGVFMQIFQPLEPEDQLLVKSIAPTKETVTNFCNQYSGVVRNNCWREAWPLFREEIQTPEGLLAFCEFPQDPEGKRSCRSAAIGIVTTQFVLNEGKIEKLKEYCTGLPQEFKNECVELSVMRLVQISPQYLKPAIEVCILTPTVSYKSQCFRLLAHLSAQLFHRESEKRTFYCRALPPPWDEYCTTLGN